MTGKTMEVPRDLAVDICNGLRITQERAVAELRELLDKTACIDCKETGFCLSIMGDEIRCPCHAPIQLAKPDELQAEPAARPQGEPAVYDPAKENKQFEAWAHTQSLVDLRLCDIGLYYERQTGLAHDAWQYRAKLAEQPVPVAVVPDGYCIMPRRLTAENGAKALLLGEFKLKVTEECPECRELDEPTEGCEICDGEGEYGQQYTISWDQIKFIYSKAVDGLAVKAETDKL